MVRWSYAALVCLLFALAPAVPAQQAVPLAGIAHVAIRVRSLAASVEFYRSLGFEEAFDLKRDGVAYESFIKVSDHQYLELYPVTPTAPEPSFLHVCFEGDDLLAIHDEYETHGLTPTVVRKTQDGNLLFTMTGPQQPIGPGGKAVLQTIEYTQYQPGSLHSNDAGQHLGADRIADRLLGVALSTTDPLGAREFYLNQLSFKPLPGQQMMMHLPGHSGDQVEIVQASLGALARITLQTASLGKATRKLGREHIKFAKSAENVVFLDPDGNQILVQQR